MQIILLLTVILFRLTSYAQTAKDVRLAIKTMATDKELKNASISFYALDLDSGKVISGYGSNKSLVPASTMKLITTATVLELLGAKKTLKTSIRYSGSIDSNHILNGNIYIKGGGDPALGSKRYKKHYGNFINKWAKEIVALGIDSINGRVIANASIFSNQMIPSTWIWGDLGNYYGAGPSGLSVYENICYLEIKSGNKGDSTQITCVTPYIPNLTFDNQVKSMRTNKDLSYIFGAPYQDNRIIKGGIPIKRSSFTVKGSIPDPAYLTAFELDMELRNLGLKISNTATTLNKSNNKQEEKTVLISTLNSPQIKSLVKQTNTYSINLYAEHFINLIGLKKYKSGDTGSGTQAVLEFWKKTGMDVEGLYINDGSGLSRFNGVTARQLVSVLTYMKDSKNASYFINSLPVAGKTGTLKSIGKGSAAYGKIRAKSGYMTRVRSYAGYVTTKNNKTIAFALIVNNYNCSAYQMKKKMEQVMIKLAEIEK